ncbi:hypothetical protein EMCRGX_G008872 [Ephydatia muelleri]
MLPQRNVEMIAELVNWLRRSLTSRRSLRPTEPGNSEEPDPEVLISVPKSDKTGIAEGQLSLEIGDLVSACTTEADLSQKVQAMSKNVMMCLLMELVGDGVSSSSESERCIVMINRGGLWTINDQAYDILLIMEEEIKRKYTFASNKQWCAYTT